MKEAKPVTVEMFVRDLVHLGGIYSVDCDGYVIGKGGDENQICTVKVGTVDKPLLVLQDVIKDDNAVVINPLNENMAESPDSKWLYKSLSIGLSQRFIVIARFLKTAIEIENGKDDNSDNIHLSSKVVEFAARHKDFDAKTLEALETISEKKIHFMNIFYDRKLKEAHFRCSVYNPDTALEFPNITKKAWKSIIALISDILGISTDVEEATEQLNNDFTIGSDLITVPKLESVLRLYLKIFQRLNRFAVMCMRDDDDFVVDVTTLGHHIENLETYYKKAKYFTNSTTTIASRPAIRTLDSGIGVGAQSSGIPSNPAITSFSSPGYVEPPSGIPSNPSRQVIEYANYGQPPQQQRLTDVMGGGGIFGGVQRTPMFGPSSFNTGFPMNPGFMSPGVPIGPSVPIGQNYQVGGYPYGGGFRQ